VVHAYCEVLHLQHESKGEGANRQLIASKPKSMMAKKPEQTSKPKSEPQEESKVAQSQQQNGATN
jgi:hypothetical protein